MDKIVDFNKYVLEKMKGNLVFFIDKLSYPFKLHYYQKQLLQEFERRKGLMEDFKYIIIEADRSIDLRDSVNSHIENGYKPIGGVAMLIDDDFIYFAQAMLKE